MIRQEGKLMSASIEQLRMLITVEADSDSLDHDRFRVTARPVRFWVADGKECVSDYFSFDHRLHRYENLQVSAFGDLSNDEGPIGERVYFNRPYRVDLADATQMVQTLRKIEAGVERTTRKVGPPESIGAYIVRVGLAIGITQFGFAHPRGEEMWANGQRYRWEDAGGVPSVVSSRIFQLRQDAQRAAA